jgi:uncharacterized protein YqgC (DUF456 family)
MEALTHALGEGTLYTLKVIAVWTLIIGGLIGTALPIVPGTVFIFMGCLAHYFFFGMEESAIGWGSLVVVAILLIVSLVVDWAGGAVGAKYFDASRWGVIGALTGGVLGIFFPFPGLLIGPLVGAFSFEMMFAKKEVKLAGKSTWGTFVGSVGGLVAKLVVALAMVVWFVVDLMLG